MKILNKLFFLLLMVSFFACDDDEADSFLVQTEEIVSISGERAIVMGRILATRTVNVQDHGFQFSLDPSFPNPIILSLGNTNRPGRFIAEQGGLLLGENYFVKSYAQTSSGQTLFGDALEFSTILPKIDTVEPFTQFPNEVVTIIGRNFGDDAQVFFGDVQAQVLEIFFGFRITVRVPAQEDGPEVPLRVLTKGREIVADRNFKYVTGKYSQLENLPQEIGFQENVYFQQNGKFFVGLGFTQQFQPISRFWEYDPGANSWTPYSVDGMVKQNAYYSLDGYFGGGYSEFFGNTNNYSESFGLFTNGSFVELTPPPFRFANSLSFDTDDFLYVIGGDLAIQSLVFRFNKATQAWELRPNFPTNVVNDMVHFSYNGKFYYIQRNRRMWEYDPITASFNHVTDYPSPMAEGISDFRGNAIVVGNIAYIGLYNNSRILWSLNLETFEWARVNDFIGGLPAFNSAWFSEDGNLYLLRTNVSQPGMEFWKLDPDAYD